MHLVTQSDSVTTHSRHVWDSLRVAFSGASSFNQPIGDWNLASVTSLRFGERDTSQADWPPHRSPAYVMVHRPCTTRAVHGAHLAAIEGSGTARMQMFHHDLDH